MFISVNKFRKIKFVIQDLIIIFKKKKLKNKYYFFFRA